MMIPESQRVPTGNAEPNDVVSGKTFMSGASFELKTGTASARTGGNATPEQVLSGKTFTNDSGEQTGTMVDHTNASPVKVENYDSGTPSEIRLPVPEGFYKANQPDYPLFLYDGNYTAGNIAVGKSIFGLSGTFTSDADAVAGDIANGKSAYVNGQKLVGTAQQAPQASYFTYSNFVGTINKNSPTEMVIDLNLLLTDVRLLAIAIQQVDSAEEEQPEAVVWNNGGGVQIKLPDLIMSSMYDNTPTPFGNTFTLQGTSDSLTITVGVPVQTEPNQYNLKVTLTTQVGDSLTTTGLGKFNIWGWTIPTT